MTNPSGGHRGAGETAAVKCPRQPNNHAGRSLAPLGAGRPASVLAIQGSPGVLLLQGVQQTLDVAPHVASPLGCGTRWAGTAVEASGTYRMTSAPFESTTRAACCMQRSGLGISQPRTPKAWLLPGNQLPSVVVSATGPQTTHQPSTSINLPPIRACIQATKRRQRASSGRLPCKQPPFNPPSPKSQRTHLHPGNKAAAARLFRQVCHAAPLPPRTVQQLLLGACLAGRGWNEGRSEPDVQGRLPRLQHPRLGQGAVRQYLR